MNRALQHLADTDPVMARLIEQIGPIRLQARRVPVFQSVLQAIVYQQLSGKAAGTIWHRFLNRFTPGAFPAPDQVLALSEAEMRAAGLSRPKIKYVRGVAEKAAAGGLPTLTECKTMSDAAILEQLTELKGVGRWTAEMFLIFNLGRPDVLPVHDLGVRKGFALAYHRRLPEPEQLERFGRRWQPYRTLAARYLWRAVDGA